MNVHQTKKDRSNEHADAPAPRRGRPWPVGAPLDSKKASLQTFVSKEAAKGPTHDSIYKQLRYMILHGEIEPCTWLRQEELTKKFGVSRTPIREALRTLSQEGLIEMVSNQGARVSPLSMESFEELYALRGGIEGLAARIAVSKLTSGHLAALQTKFAELEVMAGNVDVTVYLKTEWLFRLFLYEATGRDALLSQVKTLREHAERYLCLAYTVQGRIEESLEFHRQLLNACERSDPQLAERVVQDALRWTVSRAGPIVADGSTSSLKVEEES
ncbi:MAG: GntR family transcriptional regulator [Anaerolineales bacterium]